MNQNRSSEGKGLLSELLLMKKVDEKKKKLQKKACNLGGVVLYC